MSPDLLCCIVIFLGLAAEEERRRWESRGREIENKEERQRRLRASLSQVEDFLFLQKTTL